MTVTGYVPTVWEQCRTVTRTDGVAAGLRVLCASLSESVGDDVLPCGPSGHAVVPAEIAVTATLVWRGGVRSDRAHGAETTATDPLLAAEGLVSLCHRARPEPVTDGRDWLTGLAWLRVGHTERLLGQCVGYLEGRTTGDASLLDQQLVRGDLADAWTELAEIRAVLAGGADPALHRQLTSADRGLLRLLGASGMVADGPGRGAYASERIADAYAGEAP